MVQTVTVPYVDLMSLRGDNKAKRDLLSTYGFLMGDLTLVLINIESNINELRSKESLERCGWALIRTKRLLASDFEVKVWSSHTCIIYGAIIELAFLAMGVVIITFQFLAPHMLPFEIYFRKLCRLMLLSEMSYNSQLDSTVPFPRFHPMYKWPKLIVLRRFIHVVCSLHARKGIWR